MSYWELSRQRMTSLDLGQLRRNLQLDPGYQREGNLWSKERQQLFIDSLLNGFDVPPLYLHSLRPPLIAGAALRTYAVIDGRQRLEALWSFLYDGLELHEDAYLYREQRSEGEDSNEVSRIGRFDLEMLRDRRPDVYSRLMHYEFSVTIVETDDISLIEEMFFRLNEGVPLSPAEKRHRGKILREYLAELLSDRSALDIFRLKNRRRVHEDLLLRLLFIEERLEAGISFPDMKKRDLDEFAAGFSSRPGIPDGPAEAAAKQARLARLGDKVMDVIGAMRSLFDQSDARLGGSSWFISYYLLIHYLGRERSAVLTREALERFWSQVGALAGREEDFMTADELLALEVTGPLPASTTGSYFRERVEFLARFLRGEVVLDVRDENRRNSNA